MFDVFLLLLLARALVASVRRRFALGAAATLTGAALLVALAASGWYGRGADHIALTGAWLLVVLGPSAVPAETARVPLSSVLAGHPIAAKLALASIVALPFAVAWRSAARFSPLSDASADCKQLGLVFLMPALLLLGQVLCLALAQLTPDGF